MGSMAKIVHSETAPSEAVHYSFAGVEFDLGGKNKSFESDDPVVLSNAEAHPWLKVQRPEVELVAGAYVEQLAPKDDPYTVTGRRIDPNSADEVRKAEAAKAGVDTDLTAIDAGKDQDKAVSVDGVAETLAAADADDAPKTSTKKGN